MEENTMDLEPNIVETKEETDRKCPDCGGTMDFDPKTGGLKCPYCGHVEEVPVEEETPSKAEEMDFESAEQTANCDWGAQKKTVICKACAGESIYDALDTANVCPFCGSNQVMEANDKNTIAPGGVVPFKISKEDAAERFKKWIGGKFFCPKLAKESAKPKHFKGLYLPYWTFDTKTHSTYTAQYGIDHEYKDKDGNTKVDTKWYNTNGTYDKFIDDELVFASTRHDKNMLSGLEPFDTEDNKTYKPEYVAGFVSERYSIGLKDARAIAKNSILHKLEGDVSGKVRNEHNADHVRAVRVSPTYKNITYKYLLLPIWISSYKYKDKIYQFMVNGQTGKVSGKTPISAIKVILTILVVIAILVVIYFFTTK